MTRKPKTTLFLGRMEYFVEIFAKYFVDSFLPSAK